MKDKLPWPSQCAVCLARLRTWGEYHAHARGEHQGREIKT
jgi:hypothetical protein